MNAPPHLLEYAKPARAPVFFWITVTLLALLFLGGAAGAVLLVFEAKSINRSGGWGWLLIAAIYVVAIVIVCFACALASAVSLFRREAHRRLSIVILIISSLFVAAFGPNLIRAVHKLRHQHKVTRSSEHWFVHRSHFTVCSSRLQKPNFVFIESAALRSVRCHRQINETTPRPTIVQEEGSGTVIELKSLTENARSFSEEIVPGPL